MKRYLILLFTLVFMLSGCGNSQAEGTTNLAETEATGEALPEETVVAETELPPETQEADTETEMTQEELADFQTLFDDPMGWYARALTSEYISASEVDLEKMFYCGAGDTPVSEEELEYLKSQWDPILFEFDIVRCDVAVMEEAMQMVFGQGLVESEGVGLENMTHYNWAYFRSSSDVLITIVRLDRGVWRSDGAVDLYYKSDVVGGGECCISMELEEGRWVIRSNQQVD